MSLNKWTCSSCLTINNNNDKNIIPCSKCHILNSETNLYRAKCLYLLGNIEKPIASLLPLKTPFFIYPLAAPIVTITKDIKYDDGWLPQSVWLHFEIDYLYDIKHTEMYHIEQVKFEMYELNKIHKQKYSEFVIHNLTPYYNIFSKFIAKPYYGEFSVNIYVKCYGSNQISPMATLNFDLLPPKKHKRFLNEVPHQEIESPTKKRKLKPSLAKEEDNKQLKNKQQLIDKIKQKMENAKLKSAEKLKIEKLKIQKEKESALKLIRLSSKTYQKVNDQYESFDDEELNKALAMSLIEQSNGSHNNNNNNNGPDDESNDEKGIQLIKQTHGKDIVIPQPE
eukprot:530844_1